WRRAGHALWAALAACRRRHATAERATDLPAHGALVGLVSRGAAQQPRPGARPRRFRTAQAARLQRRQAVPVVPAAILLRPGRRAGDAAVGRAADVDPANQYVLPCPGRDRVRTLDATGPPPSGGDPLHAWLRTEPNGRRRIAGRAVRDRQGRRQRRAGARQQRLGRGLRRPAERVRRVLRLPFLRRAPVSARPARSLRPALAARAALGVRRILRLRYLSKLAAIG